jgi:glycine cleavage system pyridoxal-binding protein P
MIQSKRTHQFKKLFEEMPEQIKKNAKKQFEAFSENPNHSSLRTKLIGSTRNNKFRVYEVAIGMGYRATYFVDENVYVWFWVGTHGSFDKKY